MDQTLRLKIAIEYIRGGGKNIRQVLKYYQGRGRYVGDKLEAIEKLLLDIDQQQDIPSLMAVEGNIRSWYYKGFDDIICDTNFVFEERSRRPPKNFLNTLISFGNSIMYSICLSEIYKTHLDPRIGYLHATNFRRFSLNLDVSEIFKPILIDRTIFSLLARKMITAKDFDRDANGVLLKEKGKKCFIHALEEKLKTTINHRDLGRPVSYRRLIRLELYKLEKHLMGEKTYTPFIARW